MIQTRFVSLAADNFQREDFLTHGFVPIVLSPGKLHRHRKIGVAHLAGLATLAKFVGQGLNDLTANRSDFPGLRVTPDPDHLTPYFVVKIQLTHKILLHILPS